MDEVRAALEGEGLRCIFEGGDGVGASEESAGEEEGGRTPGAAGPILIAPAFTTHGTHGGCRVGFDYDDDNFPPRIGGSHCYTVIHVGLGQSYGP